MIAGKAFRAESRGPLAVKADVCRLLSIPLAITKFTAAEGFFAAFEEDNLREMRYRSR